MCRLCSFRAVYGVGCADRMVAVWGGGAVGASCSVRPPIFSAVSVLVDIACLCVRAVNITCVPCCGLVTVQTKSEKYLWQYNVIKKLCLIGGGMLFVRHLLAPYYTTMDLTTQPSTEWLRGQKLCTFRGNWHLAWSVPMVRHDTSARHQVLRARWVCRGHAHVYWSSVGARMCIVIVVRIVVGNCASWC